MQEVTLYSDGSSRGNPGPGGFGCVLQFRDRSGKLHELELSGGFTCTTNNRMELLGVITGLEALKRPCRVEVHSDSQYVVNAFNQHWVEGWLKRGWRNAGGASRERALRSAGHCGGGCSRSAGGRGVRRGVAFRAQGRCCAAPSAVLSRS